MGLTEREIHWRLKKMTARMNQERRFHAAIAGIEMSASEAETTEEVEALTPEMEAALARSMEEAKARISGRFSS